MSCVAAEHARGDPVVDPLEQPGQRGEVGADLLVGRLVEPRRERRRSAPRSSPRGRSAPRAWRPRSSSRAARGRACSAFQRIRRAGACRSSSPQRSASSTAVALLRVGGEERRLWLDRGRARGRSPASPVSLAPVDLQRRHRDAGEAGKAQGALRDHRHQVDALVRDPLSSSIRRDVVAGCEPGIT